MRPITKSYTPADDSATGLKSNATGATITLAANDMGDGMAHLVIFDPDLTPDLHTINMAIVGTDADGIAQTESVALSADGSATTSTKYFLTVTSITPSATLGANTVDIGWTDDVVSPTYPLDWASSAAANIMIDVSGTINFTIQETFGDVLKSGAVPASLIWSNISALASKTADTTSQSSVGATAFRILINSLTAGATIAFYTDQPVRHY